MLELKNISNWSENICSGIITDSTVYEFNNYLNEIDKFKEKIFF